MIGRARVGSDRIGSDLDEVDPAKYSLEFIRCSPETDAEYATSMSTPSLGGDTSRLLVAEYRITNRDTIRRRFQIRATRTDAAGVTLDFVPVQTDRLDPGESTTGRLTERVLESDVAPYSCDADVWESVLDAAFPDD